MAETSGFAVGCTGQGELQASVIKSHLESEGIPVFLEYESAGRVFGLTVDDGNGGTDTATVWER